MFNETYFPTAPYPIASTGSLPNDAFPGVQEVTFGPGTKLRPTQLCDETRRVYQAVSFFNASRGLVMNTLLTTSIQALTPDDLPKGVELHTKMNKALGEWLAVGGTTFDAAPPRRRNARNANGGSEHAYVYVVENARDKGLHIHQIMYVPMTTVRVRGGRLLRKSTWMQRYLETWWAKQLGVPQVRGDAIHVSPFSTRDERNALGQQWKWFRYITKTTCPTATLPNESGQHLPVREVFNIDEYRETEPAPVPQLAGGSHNIWTKAQNAAGFLSAYDRYAFGELYSGWEMDAYREQLAAAEAAEGTELLKSLVDFGN